MFAVCINVVKLYHVCMMLKTFNNISVISWHSVILVEETGVPGENCRQWPTASH